jgi:hypothetical protein
VPSHLGEEFVPAHAGHDEVGDDGIGFTATGQVSERVVAGGKVTDRVAVFLEDLREELAQLEVVLDEGYVLSHGRVP